MPSSLLLPVQKDCATQQSAFWTQGLQAALRGLALDVYFEGSNRYSVIDQEVHRTELSIQVIKSDARRQDGAYMNDLC